MAHWYVVRAAVRSERTALRELQLAGLDAYLPEQKIERFNRRKRKSIVTTLCLFPGYLFVETEASRFREIKSVKGVSDILPGYPFEPHPLSKQAVRDLLQLRDKQVKGLLDDTDEARKRRGETVKNTLAALRKRLRNKQVRVTEGPFLGFVGDVETVDSFERLKVLIDVFGRPTTVSLEMEQVEEMAA